MFVASDLEIHVLLTSRALSPPTRACLCLLSLDLVTVSTQVEFCFLLLGVRVSPSFPSSLLGLRVCLCLRLLSKVLLCSLSSACLVSLCRSVPPSPPPSLPPLPPSLSHSLFWGEGVRGSPGCHWCPSLGPRAPAAGVSVECAPSTLESRGGGGGSASPSGQPPEEIVPSSSPFLCGRGRVASRGSEAEEAPGRARAFGRPVRWRPRRPATATRPRDGRAGCQEPPGGRLYIVPRPPELRRDFQEDCDSAAGPETELSETGYAGGDSPGDTEA